MRPELPAVRDRTLAVLKERGPLHRYPRRLEALGLIVSEQRRIEECDALAKNIDIAGDPDVVRNDEREPQEIVGDPRPDSHPARRMPPVLDVPLLELTARREQDV